MPRRNLTNAIYLECLAFAITSLLAASTVEGKEDDKEWVGEVNGVVGRATHYTRMNCPDWQGKNKCTNKNALIAGLTSAGVIALFLLIMGYYALVDCRKKRKQRRLAKEENEASSDESRTESDCENGITKGSKNNKNDGDHAVPSSPLFDKSEEGMLSRSSSLSDLPSYTSYDRPPGPPHYHTYAVVFPSDRTSWTGY